MGMVASLQGDMSNFFDTVKIYHGILLGLFTGALAFVHSDFSAGVSMIKICQVC